MWLNPALSLLSLCSKGTVCQNKVRGFACGWNPQMLRGYRVCSLVSRQCVVRLIKAFGCLKKLNWCFWEFYWLVKCQKSMVPPAPCQEFFIGMLYHSKCQCVRRYMRRMKHLQELPSVTSLVTWKGCTTFLPKKIFLTSGLNLPSCSFWCCSLCNHLSQMRTVDTIISLQVRELTVSSPDETGQGLASDNAQYAFCLTCWEHAVGSYSAWR